MNMFEREYITPWRVSKYIN